MKMIISLTVVALVVAVTYSTSLKGLSWTSKQSPTPNDYSNTKSQWNYNWGWECGDTEICTPDVNKSFIPMIWGSGAVEHCPILTNSSYEALLGFNEPDNPNQSNINVSYALELWPELMATNLRLGSPATTQGQTFEWLQQFMDGVYQNNYRVDFIAVHWYGGNATKLKSFLDSVYSNYKLPVWITEFSNLNGGVNSNENLWNDFYPLLSEMTYLERYAWFTDTSTDSSKGYLLTNDGKLTDLGEQYANNP